MLSLSKCVVMVNKKLTPPASGKTSGQSVSMFTINQDNAGQRLDNYLINKLKGVPKSHIYRLLRSGQVRVNSGRKKPHYRLNIEDIVRVPPIRIADKNPVNPPDTMIETLNKAIIYENDDLLAINKPSGIAAHGGSGLAWGAIEVMKSSRPDDFLELAHRLDRETSGILLLAKSRGCLNQLHEWLRNETDQRIEKSYLALLAGNLEEQTVDAPLKKIVRGGEHMVEVDNDGQHAVSHFKPLEKFTDCTLAEIRIETGRTHQIRSHARHIGHPVACDKKYGDAEYNKNLKAKGLKRLFLHASRLVLPFEKELVLEAPLEDELSQLLKRLKNEI